MCKNNSDDFEDNLEKQQQSAVKMFNNGHNSLDSLIIFKSEVIKKVFITSL